MARPLKYATESDKPVSISLRIPRTLYEQAQQHAQKRRTTLTELVIEGLRWRLETPTDPRDVVASRDITVMQDLEQMIDARVYAVLEARGLLAHAPAATPPVIFPQTPEVEPVQDSNAVMQEQPPTYDVSKYYLGKLCPRQHDFQGTGQSLLYRRNRRCLQCDREAAQARRANTGTER